jgi:eukaryotic-like serine/threonine-protein kinase
MVDPTESRFWKATLQSELIDAEALKACFEAIPPEKCVADQLDRRMARQAVQSGYLTLWQAKRLLSGRSTGFKVNRYVLLDLIGQGGMGRVYVARDTRLNRRVAVKILSRERVNNFRAVARFQREARVGAQLQHENLVRIYDEGEDNGKCYLVMEYIEGKNIGTIIAQDGPMAPGVAARLVRQVALGLEHAQQKGLIHRDVNPYNILVTREGVAKLTDLGLAIDLSDQVQVTREGAMVGTFDYVSPEQARHSRAVDTRSDIYSLGCTLYHMLTGKVPFPSPSLSEKLFGHQSVEPEPVNQLVPGVPEGLAEVVRQMMKKSPDERYASPKDLAQALEPYVDDLEPRSPDDAPRVRLAVAPPLAETKITGRIEPSSASALTSAPKPAPSAEPKPVAPAPKPAPVPPPQAAPAEEEEEEQEEAEKQEAPRGIDRRLLIGAGAAVMLVVAVGVAFGLGLIGGKSGQAKATTPKEVAKTEKNAEETNKPTVAVNTSQPKAGADTANVAPKGISMEDELDPEGLNFAVRMPHGNLIREIGLKNAIRRAIGSSGRVLLDNRRPLKLSGDDVAIDISGGLLVIGAAPGVRPVLEVEIKGQTPVLLTQSKTPLKLIGVTIVARYTGQNPNQDAPPVILAGDKVTLERCAFKVSGGAKGSCAVLCEGGELTATGCWFEGFDRALDFSACAGYTLSVEQCMMVRTKAAEGWAVRARNHFGGDGKSAIRTVILERCTAQGKGLLELADFSPRYPVDVEVKECAAVTNALLAWEHPKSEDVPLTPEALRWSGQGNQYDVRGGAWIVLKPEGALELANGPTDLSSWRKRFTDRAAIQPPVKFATDPSLLSEAPQPSDFAIATKGAYHVGADPRQVGPPAGPAR